MTAKDHGVRVTALVAGVFILPRLGPVTAEMNYEFEGLRRSVFGGLIEVI